MKIAMLSVHTCPLAALGGKETGGMNVYVREISRELGLMGIEVDVFTRSQDAQVPQVVTMGKRVRVVHLVAGPQHLLPREEVYHHLGEFVDSLETFSIREGITYDLIHSHYWLSGVAGLELKTRWGAPMLQMFHTLGRLKNAVARRPEERELPLRLEEEERLVKTTDGLIAASPVDRAHLIRQYGASPDRITVVPCGVDTALFRSIDPARAKAELGLGPEPVVLYVGRLAPIKGVETLLASIPRLRQKPTVLIVGGGLDEPTNGHMAALRSVAREMNLNGTTRFLGAQPQERLPHFYSAAAVTVVPSYYESFGMVALEAMACGCPVIASRVGGLTTTVEDGINGFLIPEGDPEILARHLDRILTTVSLRRRLGEGAAQTASRYRWPCIAKAIARLYAQFLPAAALLHSSCC
jgi:D-inositol-3-phosphate glycosyltransferase